MTTDGDISSRRGGIRDTYGSRPARRIKGGCCQLTDFQLGPWSQVRRVIVIEEQLPRAEAPKIGALILTRFGRYVVYEIRDLRGAPDLVRVLMLPCHDPDTEQPVRLLQR
jgi:hypothetical protein